MLGPALTLTLLFLAGRQSQASFDSSENKLQVSGEPVCLRAPSNQRVAKSFTWKVQRRSSPDTCVIYTWKNGSEFDPTRLRCNRHFNNRLKLHIENLTLVIRAAQQQDSGVYCLETTYNNQGDVRTHQFNVSILDPVGTPKLRKEQEALDGGKCRLTLSCFVPGDVKYTWYRGSERILEGRNLTVLKEQIEVNISSPHVYTCRVSNPVSQANRTLSLRQACLSAPQESGPLPLWMIIVSLVIIVLLLVAVTVTVTCIWRRKRKAEQSHPEEPAQTYEDVSNFQIRSNQKQRKEETTIYSMIQPQLPACTPESTANTLYAVVQSSQKCGSQKRNGGPSLSCTIYEEVGKRQGRAETHHLTRKELENFQIYS